jgi:hypothetical protein
MRASNHPKNCKIPKIHGEYLKIFANQKQDQAKAFVSKILKSQRNICALLREDFLRIDSDILSKRMSTKMSHKY